jgi:hypothetical protein
MRLTLGLLVVSKFEDRFTMLGTKTVNIPKSPICSVCNLLANLQMSEP